MTEFIPETHFFYLEEEVKKTQPSLKPSFYLEEELKRHATTFPETLLLLRGGIEKTCYNLP